MTWMEFGVTRAGGGEADKDPLGHLERAWPRRSMDLKMGASCAVEKEVDSMMSMGGVPAEADALLFSIPLGGIAGR